MSPSRLHRAAVLGIVALVAAAATVGGVAVAQETGGEAADDVYVTESGDAVLVYQGEQTAADTTAEYGVDVDAGLAYAFVETTDVPDGSVEAHLTSAFVPGAFGAEGNLSAPKPDSLESLSMDLAGVSNDEQSTVDATLSATVSETTGFAAFLESAATNGSITIGADSLQASGQFEATAPAITGEGDSASFSLTEQNGSYTIEVAQNRHVTEFAVDDWRSREVARQHLQSQYLSVVRALGGDGSVTIDDYDLEELDPGDYRLDVAYTVTVDGIESRLEDLLASQLANDGRLNSSQAQALASSVTDLQINEISASYDVGEGTATGSATVDVENYGDLLLAYFDVADDLGASPDAFQALDRARGTFEAQRAADMQQEASWSGEVTVGDQTTVEAEIHQSATNWGAYVDELESRDLPTTDTRFALAASTSADRVEANGSLSYSGEEALQQMIARMRNASDLSGESVRLLQAVEQAGLQKAKLQADYDDGFQVEAGASFEDLGVLRDAIVATGDAPAFASIVGRPDNDGPTTSYVRITGAVDDEMTESAVREIPGVGEETTIHMPGTWDREFPSMDTERAGDFVDVDSGVQAGSSPSSSGSGPGFGVVAGLLAVLGVALLARRRGV